MWLDNSKTRIFFDMHLPSWPGLGIASAFAPGHLADSFASAGADSVIVYAKCQYGNFYTRLPGEELHPGLEGLDLLEELSAALKARGLRTIAYYSVSWDEKIAAEHPEWLAENAKGEKGTGPYRWKTLCINSPYADLVERHVADICRKSVDGLWLDMTIIGEGNCHCPRCRQSYFDLRGRFPPQTPGDPDYPDFLAFRYDLVEAFYARISSAAKKANSTLSYTNNYWGYPYSSTAMGSRAVGAAARSDFLTGEAYTDWTGLRTASFLPIFLRSVAGGRPFESLVSRFVNTWDYSVKPLAFLSYECFSVFAHGATVTVDDAPFHDGRLDEALYGEDITPVFREIRKHASCVDGKPLRYAAVFHSQKTKDAEADQADFIRDVSGAFRILRDLHLGVEFIFDENLSKEKIEGLELIILPEVKNLDESDWTVLEAFMESGGLVVASGVTGSGAAAASVDKSLGVLRRGSSPWSISYLRLRERASRDILVRGRYMTYEASGTGPGGPEFRGEIIDPICETGKETFFHNNLPAPHSASGCPGIIRRSIGRGNLVVFTQPVFRHYAKQPSKEIREELNSLIRRHCPRQAIELRIPMKLDYSIFGQNGTYHVHLLNPNMEPSLCCGLMDTYEGNFERSYEYMEEIVPVHDLRILVPSGRVKSVEALREGSATSLSFVDGVQEILVERVALWEIIRIVLTEEAN